MMDAPNFGTGIRYGSRVAPSSSSVLALQVKFDSRRSDLNHVF